MERKSLLSLVIAALFVLGSPLFALTLDDASAMRRDGAVDFIRADGSVAASVVVEIADSMPARMRGLMGREVPDFSEGMLFVFETPQVLHFWMRHTPTSLDMIFVAEGGEILNIAHRTTPNSDTVYSSSAAALYVVEVKGGFSEHFGVAPGGRIEWRRW